MPMVHTAVLVDLQQMESDLLAYDPVLVADYPGPRDDIIVFALPAGLTGVDLQVCNDRYYGVVPVSGEEDGTLDTVQDLLNQALLETTVHSPPLVAAPLFALYFPCTAAIINIDLLDIFFLIELTMGDRPYRLFPPLPLQPCQ